MTTPSGSREARELRAGGTTGGASEASRRGFTELPAEKQSPPLSNSRRGPVGAYQDDYEKLIPVHDCVNGAKKCRFFHLCSRTFLESTFCVEPETRAIFTHPSPF